jgi:hypothetical protein
MLPQSKLLLVGEHDFINIMRRMLIGGEMMNLKV